MKWFVLPKILSVYKTFSTLGHVKNDEKTPKIDFCHFVNAVHLFSIYKKNKKLTRRNYSGKGTMNSKNNFCHILWFLEISKRP